MQSWLTFILLSEQWVKMPFVLLKKAQIEVLMKCGSKQQLWLGYFVNAKVCPVPPFLTTQLLFLLSRPSHIGKFTSLVSFSASTHGCCKPDAIFLSWAQAGGSVRMPRPHAPCHRVLVFPSFGFVRWRSWNCHQMLVSGWSALVPMFFLSCGLLELPSQEVWIFSSACLEENQCFQNSLLMTSWV